MENELRELCRHLKVISIIGLSKSSGKTFVLNRLIQTYKSSAPLAVTSVGHGGEVRLFKGMYAATAAGLLREADFTRLIRHTTGINTPLGEVVVTQALSNGRAGLAGPSINSQLSALCRYMLDDLGAGQVIVDGAGDKRTFAADSDGVILCAGAAFNRDMRLVARECAFICRLMGLPRASDTWDEDTVLHDIPGALTDDMLSEITNASDIKRTAVVVGDSSRVFVNTETLDRFMYRGGRLYLRNPANLIAITLNPAATGYSFDRAAFFAAVKELVDVPIFLLENDI